MNVSNLSSVLRWMLVSLLVWNVGLSVAWASEPQALASLSKAERSELAEIMGAFRAMPGLEAEFLEEKHLGLLAVPLRSEGTLYYAPGGYLARHIQRPQSVRLVVTPRELRIEEPGNTQRIDLRARTEVAHFVQSFLWILSGDESALNTHFEVRYQPKDAGDAWVLSLQPKDTRMAHIVARILVRGKGAAVLEVEVQEANGDRAITRMGKTQPERRFGDDEFRDVFGEAKP